MNTLSLQIRPMEQKDEKAVLHIERLCSTNPWQWELFVSGNSSNPISYQVLENMNKNVLGFICMSDLGIDIEVQNLAIHPNWQQKGLASYLLEHVIRQGKLNQKERILLEVRENNFSAIRLYQKYFFKLDGKRKGYYNQGKTDAYLMSFDLL